MCRSRQIVAKKILRLTFFAIVCAALAALLMYYVRAPDLRGASRITRREGNLAGDNAHRDDAATANAMLNAHQWSRAALPPENASLKDTYKNLVQHSDAGSASASLRLFKNLRTCDLRRGSQSVLDGVYYHRTGQDSAAYAEQIRQKIEHEPALKQALDQLDHSDALCDGMSAEQIGTRGEYLRRAALQNDPEAMVCYLSSYELGPAYLSEAWFDYASRWQLEAPSMAQRALDAGEPGILALLIDAYMPDDPNIRRMYALSEVYAPDPQLAYALSLVSARLAQGSELAQVQGNLTQLASILQPGQAAKARALADALWPRFEQHSSSAPSLEPCHEFLSLPADSVDAVGVGQ